MEKKMLNVAYLNGAEGLHKRGGASSGGSGEGSGSNLKYLPKYYSIDWSVADEGWKTLLKDGNMRIASTLKRGGTLIAASGVTVSDIQITAFSFLPVGIQNIDSHAILILETLESTIDFLKTSVGISVSMNGIKEISEEEYYSFDNTNAPES